MNLFEHASLDDRGQSVRSDRLSRRGFLAASGGMLAAGGMAAGADISQLGVAIPAANDEDQPLRLPPDHQPSKVVMVSSAHALAKSLPQRAMVAEMITSALTGVTGAGSIDDAWRQILKPDDIIALKFNRSGQQILGTTPVVATFVIQSLISAGFDPQQLVLIEAPGALETQFGTMPAAPGYDEQGTDFGSGRDRFAMVLDQVTSIVNIPYIKTHNIAGMTGCLKNLSHALIKHPARYHANGCAPYVADIVNQPKIRSKLRLHLMDGLRMVFRDGPVPRAEGIEDAGVILASRDPVAGDAVGLSLINRIRSHRKMSVIGDYSDPPPALAAAHRRGLGVALLRGVEVVRKTF